MRRRGDLLRDDFALLVGRVFDLANRGGAVGWDDGAEAVAALTPEAGNDRSVLLAALERDVQPKQAVAGIIAFGQFQRFAGIGDTRALDSARAASARHGWPELEAQCLFWRGLVGFQRSDDDGARARFEEALPLYRRVGATLGEANCIRSLGEIALARSDHDGARRRFEEALPLHRCQFASNRDPPFASNNDPPGAAEVGLST